MEKLKWLYVSVRSVAVEERRGERVAGNVADLQTHPAGEARQSRTRADPSAEIPIGYIRVSRYTNSRAIRIVARGRRRSVALPARKRALSFNFQTQEGEDGSA